MRLIRTPLISLPTVFVEQSLRARFVYTYIYIVHTLCSYNYIVAGTNLRNGRPTIPSSCATSNRCSSFIAYNEVTCRIQCENVALPLRSPPRLEIINLAKAPSMIRADRQACPSRAWKHLFIGREEDRKFENYKVRSLLTGSNPGSLLREDKTEGRRTDNRKENTCGISLLRMILD